MNAIGLGNRGFINRGLDNIQQPSFAWAGTVPLIDCGPNEESVRLRVGKIEPALGGGEGDGFDNFAILPF